MSILQPVLRPVLQPLSLSLTRAGVVLGPYARTGAYTAVIGDSIDAGATATTSWWEMTCRLSGQRMRRYVNKGVGGNTTAQMLSRISTDIIALSPKPDICVIGGCTNDIGQGVDPAVTRQNYVDMVSQLQAAGIRPMFRNTPSNNTAGAGAFNTVALRRQAVVDHNSWLSGYCSQNGFALLDIFTPTFDGTGLDPTMTSDGTHFNDAGCYAAAAYVADRLPGFIASAKRPYLCRSSSDAYNILPNGTFEGDSNGDGVANGGWSVIGSTAQSLVATDVGNFQSFSVDGSTLGYLLSPANTLVGGHVYEASMRVKVGVGRQVKVRVQVRDASNASLSTVDYDWVGEDAAVEQLVFYRIAVPANGDHLSMSVQGSTGSPAGTIQVAQFTVLDRTLHPDTP